MDSDPTDATLALGRHQAMLFSPPQPPLRLQPGSEIVIGRHHSCQLSVRCDDVSRRHAEVRSEGSHFEIEDLSSTNGTFVNGEKIEGARALMPGDRIEIGSILVTFCTIEAAMDSDKGETDPGQTVLQLESRPSEAFRGALSEIPPFALLQVLEMGSKTGVLEFEGGEVPGRIWFSHGLPVHSESEKQLGFDAALRMVSATQGRFRFEPQEITVDRTIQASVTELLLEACRIADEADA
jgi:pSer/pThr/pTyr-binding forkhead associated (FHA) protein